MADRSRDLRKVGKSLLVLGIATALASCYYARRSFLESRQSGPLPAEKEPALETNVPGGWYDINIEQAGWSEPWFAGPPASSNFGATVVVTTQHGWAFVVWGELVVKDGATGERLRSWKEWKRLRCEKHATENDRTTGSHRAQAEFQFAWDGKDAFGNAAREASHEWVFVAGFRRERDQETGEIGIDRTAPSVAILQPSGSVTGSSVAVDVDWSDGALSGIDAGTGVVRLDGSAVTGLVIDASGASGTIEGVLEGQHALAASVMDLAGNEASANRDFEVVGEPSVTQTTSIVGIVRDSIGQALEGVLVNSAGASRSATTSAEGLFLLPMSSGGTHWLNFELAGYVSQQRPAEVPEGQHYQIGAIQMLLQDSRVTTVTPDGGTATNSSGEVELTVPAGALSAPVDIRITHVPSSKVLPGPLNATTGAQYPIAYTFWVVLEPGGTSFASPATFRYPNRWGFSPGDVIPTAFWDDASNEWIPDGGQMTVSADGSKIEKQITSFAVPGSALRAGSKRAGASAAADEEPPAPPAKLDGNKGSDSDASTGGDGNDPDPNPCTPNESSVTVPDSAYSKSISLPSISAMGSNTALSFTYRSDEAWPSKFINILHSFGTNSGTLDSWHTSVQINGQRKEVTFSPATSPTRLLYFWDSLNGAGDLSPTGLYTFSVATSARYPGYYTNETT